MDYTARVITVSDRSFRGERADAGGPAVAERLRAEGVKAELSCSYSVRWFARHPEFSDILADPEAEARRAQEYGGPACGLRWG